MCVYELFKMIIVGDEVYFLGCVIMSGDFSLEVGLFWVFDLEGNGVVDEGGV